MSLQHDLRGLSEQLVPAAASGAVSVRRQSAQRDLEILLKNYEVNKKADSLPPRGERTKRLRRLAAAWRKLPLADRIRMELAAGIQVDLAEAAVQVADSLPGGKGGHPGEAMQILREGALLVFQRYTGRRATTTKTGKFAVFLEQVFSAAGLQDDDVKGSEHHVRAATDARDHDAGLFAASAIEKTTPEK